MPGTRKLGRETAHRTAMLRAMVTFLLENGRMETTVTRAKEVRALAEKMITIAKDSSLHSKRQVYSYITKESVAKKLIEEVAQDVYPGLGVSPYCMTGGTDAKYYTKICDNCIRFAPIYINGQQYGSIHGLNENINQGALPKAVDFYKMVIKKANSRL